MIWKIIMERCCVYFLKFLRGTKIYLVLKKETWAPISICQQSSDGNI